MLIRSQFAFAPNAIHMLNAANPDARDKYAHLGFEASACLRDVDSGGLTTWVWLGKLPAGRGPR